MSVSYRLFCYTIDHSFLLTRLSYIGSASTAPSSTSSSPTCHLATSVSDVITLSRPSILPPVVSQGSVLGPLFFIMYTTPSALSSPPFPLTITFMQTTPNCFLTLTTQLQLKQCLPTKHLWENLFLDDCQSPNSQFLQGWIGLKKQLDKTHNTSFNTNNSARSPDFIFDEHLTFSDQISAMSKARYYHIDSFALSVFTSVPPQHPPLPTPSFTPNSITVIFSTQMPASNRSRTLLPVLLLKLLNSVTSLLSYALFTGSKYNRTHRTHTPFTYKTSHSPNIHICITSSLFNLLAARAIHLWLLSLDH